MNINIDYLKSYNSTDFTVLYGPQGKMLSTRVLHLELFYLHFNILMWLSTSRVEDIGYGWKFYTL